MTRTKRDLVDAMVSRAVYEACAHLCLMRPDRAPFLKEWYGAIVRGAVYNLVGQDYRWLELCDVMNWRRRKIRDGPRERFQEDES